jgi:hypothetical protein
MGWVRVGGGEVGGPAGPLPAGSHVKRRRRAVLGSRGAVVPAPLVAPLAAAVLAMAVPVALLLRRVLRRMARVHQRRRRHLLTAVHVRHRGVRVIVRSRCRRLRRKAHGRGRRGLMRHAVHAVLRSGLMSVRSKVRVASARRLAI